MKLKQWLGAIIELLISLSTSRSNQFEKTTDTNTVISFTEDVCGLYDDYDFEALVKTLKTKEPDNNEIKELERLMYDLSEFVDNTNIDSYQHILTIKGWSPLVLRIENSIRVLESLKNRL